MKPANVELQIEELVLEGFDAGDRHRIAEAAKAELVRLFAEEGVPPSLVRGAEIGTLDVGAFGAGTDPAPEAIGAGIARAVHGGLIA